MRGNLCSYIRSHFSYIRSHGSYTCSHNTYIHSYNSFIVSYTESNCREQAYQSPHAIDRPSR